MSSVLLNATYSYETFDEENELIKIEEPVICPAKATMDICFEDGFISVDIMWADDAWTEHHWSYVGNGNPEDTEFTLIGRYTIDHYTNDGFFTEEIVAENISATLSLGKDNCYYWYDLNEDTDHECVFELPEL